MTVMGDNKLELRVTRAHKAGAYNFVQGSCDIWFNGEKVATVGAGVETFSSGHPEDDQGVPCGNLSARSFFHSVVVIEEPVD